MLDRNSFFAVPTSAEQGPDDQGAASPSSEGNPKAPAPQTPVAKDADLLDAYSQAVINVASGVGPAVIAVAARGDSARRHRFRILADPRWLRAHEQPRRPRPPFVYRDDRRGRPYPCRPGRRRSGNRSGRPAAGRPGSPVRSVWRVGIAARGSTGDRHGKPVRLPFDRLHRRGERGRSRDAQRTRPTDRKRHSTHGSAQPGKLRRSARRFAGSSGGHQYGHHRDGSGSRFRGAIANRRPG